MDTVVPAHAEEDAEKVFSGPIKPRVSCGPPPLEWQEFQEWYPDVGVHEYMQKRWTFAKLKCQRFGHTGYPKFVTELAGKVKVENCPL